MRAYLIDPFARTVSVMDYAGDYRSIHRLIGAALFDAVAVDNHGTTLYVDDEGLFRERQAFFSRSGSRFQKPLGWPPIQPGVASTSVVE